LAAFPEATATDTRLVRPARIESSEVVRGLWTSVPRALPLYASPPPPAKHGKKARGESGGAPQKAVARAPASVVTVAPSPVVTTIDKSNSSWLHVGTPAEAGVCLSTGPDGATWTSHPMSAVVLEGGQEARFRVDASEASNQKVREDVWLVRAERLTLGEGDKA